ncbi:NHLP family bacteriocin export ABC transporter peptidase/permease/ATPase subunit [Pseudobutyrivibrio sp.]|uniref:NHLP family bacteriocin export ABC transporter peptidase/permease/ATPase subunit n=1 Tax=Pseudobutyrivibrio sp. TaxID=2014367 RepID=UPI001B7511D2|nr:NHLP family bacteriocin export ABC transporter peptidase/permease/ATPase subunit [Pseudobutyrivibrio sp.]MBP3262411.1 NHLP family bacteriocin export ABC transporter peptidase/permease/ATPase subunit [Pseudobutyrivibrio sp.]
MGRKKIPPTITKGVAKVPVILQLEALECGAACLAMVLAYYGKWIPLEQVRCDCGVSRDGSNAKNIYKAAISYGFNVNAYKVSPEELRDTGKYPCIIHWNMNHFVVLNGFKGNKVYINDPAKGNIVISWDIFDSSFTGVVLIPTPSDTFKMEGKPKSTFAYAKKRLAGAGGMVVFVMITTAMVYLFGIFDSATSRIFVDRLLSGVNSDWLYPFMMLMIVIGILHIIVAWIQAIYSLKINGKMAVISSCSYMWKVLRLPMEFFSQRLAGDIQGRLLLNSSIAKTLVNTFGPLLINSIMMVLYLCLMLTQSSLLTLVGICTLLLNVILARYISKKRVNTARVQMRDASKKDATTVSGIHMIETIKASGAENGFFEKWAGLQASTNECEIAATKTELLIGTIPTFFNIVSNYIVLVLGVYLVMEKKFSLGAVLMFQGLLSSFITPANTLISVGQTITQMRSSMERVEDVMQYPDDVALDVKNDLKEQAMAKLKGEVEIRNLTFGYSKVDEPLIKNFNLTIKPGERVAIVGASGCGKSTLSKVISGLYQPWSGDVLYDGKPRSMYPREVMTGSIAVVDQDIILFEDTIANNIRMWDESIKDFEVILAARDAKIHDDILRMQGGYNHKITSGGRDLSGGQRQRMEIARVLAQDPMIIILDEATSALDAKTEYEVVNAIKDRGITCIVIAHRLSTIKDCDKIVVLNKGCIVEQGKHEDLIKADGEYAKLLANE